MNQLVAAKVLHVGQKQKIGQLYALCYQASAECNKIHKKTCQLKKLL